VVSTVRRAGTQRRRNARGPRFNAVTGASASLALVEASGEGAGAAEEDDGVAVMLGDEGVDGVGVEDAAVAVTTEGLGACPARWEAVYFVHVMKAGGGLLTQVIRSTADQWSRDHQGLYNCPIALVHEPWRLCPHSDKWPARVGTAPNPCGDLLRKVKPVDRVCRSKASVRMTVDHLSSDFVTNCNYYDAHYDFSLWDTVLEPRFGGRVSLVTILRHPVERAVSAYFFTKADAKMNIRKFVDIEDPPPITKQPAMKFAGRNFMTKFFAGVQPQCSLYDRGNKTAIGASMLEVAKRNLRKFCFVGIYERKEESVALLHALHGWTPVETTHRVVHSLRPKTFTLSQKDRKYIEQRNDLDVQLYEYAVTLFEEQLKAAGIAPPAPPE